MKTTIKQQIHVVQRALKAERENNLILLYDRSATVRQLKESNARIVKLNDAASTLAAVNMIGVDKIKLLPETMELLDKSYGALLRIAPSESDLKDKLESILDKLQLKKQAQKLWKQS